jgi:hypothetical protein
MPTFCQVPSKEASPPLLDEELNVPKLEDEFRDELLNAPKLEDEFRDELQELPLGLFSDDEELSPSCEPPSEQDNVNVIASTMPAAKNANLFLAIVIIISPYLQSVS